MGPHRTPISAVILTRNEERHIERCIRSAAFADEVLVFDSGSTDATCEIARRCGARVVEHAWVNYQAQANAAAATAPHDWVLLLDADEVVSGDLQRSIAAVAQGPMHAADGYVVDRLNDFLGVMLPTEARSSKRRTHVRLFNRQRSRFPEERVHEEIRVPGRLVALDGVLLHWRGQSFTSIAETFVRYAELESEELERRGMRATGWRMFGRTAARFGWVYVVKRYYRLGSRGLLYAMLKANSELLRYGRLWERQNVPEPVQDPPRELL